MNAAKEKSIRRIGTYFLVLGVISALYGIAFHTGIVIPICIILMCIPRLICDKKWAVVSLMISSILMSIALFYFLDIPFLLSEEYDGCETGRNNYRWHFDSHSTAELLPVLSPLQVTFQDSIDGYHVENRGMLVALGNTGILLRFSCRVSLL